MNMPKPVKITGMLLEIDNSEINKLLEDKTALDKKVQEAVRVILTSMSTKRRAMNAEERAQARKVRETDRATNPTLGSTTIAPSKKNQSKSIITLALAG